jgi:hypothetical protein
MKSIFLLTWIDHPQMLQGKVLQGDVHGTASSGCIRIFEFKAIAFALKILMSGKDIQGLFEMHNSKPADNRK